MIPWFQRRYFFSFYNVFAEVFGTDFRNCGAVDVMCSWLSTPPQKPQSLFWFWLLVRKPVRTRSLLLISCSILSDVVISKENLGMFQVTKIFLVRWSELPLFVFEFFSVNTHLCTTEWLRSHKWSFCGVLC